MPVVENRVCLREAEAEYRGTLINEVVERDEATTEVIECRQRRVGVASRSGAESVRCSKGRERASSKLKSLNDEFVHEGLLDIIERDLSCDGTAEKKVLEDENAFVVLGGLEFCEVG